MLLPAVKHINQEVYHDDVIKWKHFPRYWPFVRGIHRSPVNSPHKGQWRGALMFSLIYAWINCWVNNRETGDLRRHRAHFDVNVMSQFIYKVISELDAVPRRQFDIDLITMSFSEWSSVIYIWWGQVSNCIWRKIWKKIAFRWCTILLNVTMFRQTFFRWFDPLFKPFKKNWRDDNHRKNYTCHFIDPIYCIYAIGCSYCRLTSTLTIVLMS